MMFSSVIALYGLLTLTIAAPTTTEFTGTLPILTPVPMIYPTNTTINHNPGVQNKNGITCCRDSNPLGWYPGKVFDGIYALLALKLIVVEHGCYNIGGCTGGPGIGGEVILCNYNHYRISPNARYIASYAYDIVNRCNFRNTVCGQETDSDNYLVILRGCGD